jgi:hypothetical protein
MAIFANFGLTLAPYLQIAVASKWTIALASLPSRHRLNEFLEKIADERKELQVSFRSVHAGADNGPDPRKFDNPQELFAAATRSINTGGGKGRAISRAPARDSRSCARQQDPCTRGRHRRFRTCRLRHPENLDRYLLSCSRCRPSSPQRTSWSSRWTASRSTRWDGRCMLNGRSMVRPYRARPDVGCVAHHHGELLRTDLATNRAWDYYAARAGFQGM